MSEFQRMGDEQAEAIIKYDGLMVLFSEKQKEVNERVDNISQKASLYDDLHERLQNLVSASVELGRIWKRLNIAYDNPHYKKGMDKIESYAASRGMNNFTYTVTTNSTFEVKHEQRQH